MLSFRTVSIPAILACAAMAATPGSAMDLPMTSMHVSLEVDAGWSEGIDRAAHYRRWRGYRPYHRRDRVDAGDVIAGVLIIGGIAAIASAVSSDRDRYRDYRYREHRDWNERYRESRDRNGSGLDNAIDMCVEEIERDTSVDDVDSVNRTVSGWMVSGRLADGGDFLCRIGNDGRVDDIEFTSGERAEDRREYRGEDDRQWSDDRYAAARAEYEAGRASDTQPAYPGGPLRGDPVPVE